MIVDKSGRFVVGVSSWYHAAAIYYFYIM